MKYIITSCLALLVLSAATAQKTFNPKEFYRQNKSTRYEQQRDSLYKMFAMQRPSDPFEDMMSAINSAPYYDTVHYMSYRMQETMHLREIDKVYGSYGFTPEYAFNTIHRMSLSGAFAKNALSNIIFLVRGTDGLGYAIMVDWNPVVGRFCYTGMSSQTDLIIQAGTYLFIPSQG